jgi:hypothetical protein
MCWFTNDARVGHVGGRVRRSDREEMTRKGTRLVRNKNRKKYTTSVFTFIFSRRAGWVQKCSAEGQPETIVEMCILGSGQHEGGRITEEGEEEDGETRKVGRLRNLRSPTTDCDLLLRVAPPAMIEPLHSID